jgi:hypothetical protein
VVELRFDNQGVLRHVTALGPNDALPVSVVSRTTPAPGTEASVMQQLFGNIGRFNPAGALGGGSASPPAGPGFSSGSQLP